MPSRVWNLVASVTCCVCMIVPTSPTMCAFGPPNSITPSTTWPRGSFRFCCGSISRLTKSVGNENHRPTRLTANRGLHALCRCALRNEMESTVKLRNFKVWYKVINPVIEHRPPGASDRLPLVVLHGGPGIPSDYLEPLGQLAHKYGRAVYFYDQLGCGNSDEPQDPAFYSVEQCAEDVVSMVQHFADWCGLLDKGGFHLLGQSWGGCLASEVVVSNFQGSDALRRGLVSVVLSATPITPRHAISRAGSLIEQYKNETLSMTPEEMGMRADWPRSAEWLDQWRAQMAHDKFQRLHNIRQQPHEPPTPTAAVGAGAVLPACLSRSLSKAGVVWRGAEAVGSWRMDAERLRAGWPGGVRCLVLRGEHDFVDEGCVSELMEGIPAGLVEYARLDGLSHMAHLEDTPRYLAALDGYFRRVEAGRPLAAAPPPTR